MTTPQPSPIRELSIADLFEKFSSLLKYLKSRWLIIAVFCLTGIFAGLCYSFLKTPTYTAVSTFVLEDSKISGGQYSGLASLVGISLPSGGSGIFEGDNIIELYKSRTMIEKALLTPCNFNGHNQLLIDRFIDKNDLRATDKNDKDKIGPISFAGDPSNFNRQQDSIVTVLVNRINKKVLSVTKPDKKLSIISVEVTSADELFSKYLSDKIVQTVNDFYVLTKTKKALQTVLTLQRRSDSVRSVLNSSIRGVAAANDADPNANPLLSSLRVGSQKKQIDVQAGTAIYSEMIKNLELAKLSLNQETPLIQVIDKAVLPLKKNQVGKLKGMVVGGFLFGLLCVFWITVKKVMQVILNK